MLEWCFIQCGRIVAVFLTVVQSAHTAPHDSFFTVSCPCAAAIQGPALTADQPLRERILAGVGGHPCDCVFRRTLCCIPPCHLRLYGIILFTADNALVVIFNEVHGKLACILDGLAVDKVLPEGLLHQHITAVFFILQDAADAGNGPLRRILEALDALLFQFIFDHPQAGSGEIALIEPSDDFRLFRNDLRLTILTFAVAVQLFILDADLSSFHGAALTPCDIGGDRFTFRLGEGTGEGDSQLTVLLQRIDVFLLEDDCDAKLFERPDIVEAVHRIAGEAGDRFGQDDIDFLLAAVPNHPHEVLTLLGRGSGDALVYLIAVFDTM